LACDARDWGWAHGETEIPFCGRLQNAPWQYFSLDGYMNQDIFLETKTRFLLVNVNRKWVDNFGPKKSAFSKFTFFWQRRGAGTAWQRGSATPRGSDSARVTDVCLLMMHSLLSLDGLVGALCAANVNGRATSGGCGNAVMMKENVSKALELAVATSKPSATKQRP
jgi:hypothetical protein